jgi:predicted nucleic-acid-binding protein
MIQSFTHDAVDAVQKGKLQFVSAFVKHEGLAETMTKFVQAQTEYTKSVLDTNIDTMLNLGTLITKKDFIKDLISVYGFDKFVPTMPAAPAKAASKKAK